ncbi:MAG: aminotransferase class V-fold PLP-dependent enzyme [Bacteroidetes bacterium]|nr:aminotransferase class V-fold PLP-dependent enzyme [Bacteroidota bacterium]MBU1114243.1 aminotransferase class V-fold PLP-dependent enzyme [Bacteroidota bacterium]MBU1798012.1 aminotransferase class V-fold PLP-dependent enzyme [Bacteroidota bacterium]
MTELEKYFESFRNNIVGIDQTFNSPWGEKKIIYSDWIASGRLYGPIEEKIKNQFGPFVGNTHTETSVTGTTMTNAYHIAQNIIKKHCNANEDDVIITAGSGMTAVINKLQRILGFKLSEQLKQFTNIPDEFRPVVFLTHMEHHSNQTSWFETIADTVVIEPNDEGLVDENKLVEALRKYNDRKVKIGSFTACSNVTGIRTQYHKLAKIMHQNGGLCFIDFAASAPYDEINMHPEDEEERLDAIFFSPHKFLGGPGTSGVLIFSKYLYKRNIPDHPGGGTVEWTNPWGEHRYVENIETREDGGTPGFLQAIRSALCIKLKEEMGIENIRKREEELLTYALNRFREIPKIHLLATNIEDRLGIISFYVEEIHFNLMVKLLNDLYGIQMRGGCSCAGTYGHYLLHIDPSRSKSITDMIDKHDFSQKPGWVRFSLHPTMTDTELAFIMDAIEEIVNKIDLYVNDYKYNSSNNEYYHISETNKTTHYLNDWFYFS